MKKQILLILFLVGVGSGLSAQSPLWTDYINSSPRGQGATLANYSYAGYHYSEKELPKVDASTYTYFDVTYYGAVANDGQSDRKAVVDAINAAEASGGKAVVYFPAGRFNLNGKEDFGKYPIVITKGNIVLKGAGQHLTELYFDQPAFLNSEPFIRITPSYPNNSYWRGDSKLGDVTSYPEKGGFQVNVTNADKFKPGMVVNFDADLYTRSERGKGYFLPHQPPEGVDDREDYFFELHQVEKVVGSSVYFKEPIHLDLPHLQDAFIREIENIIEECGIEDLTISGNYREQFKHHNGSRFGERYDMVHFEDARNCWMRNVRIKNYSNAIHLQRAIACSFFNINLVGHTGHNCIGGVYSYGNLFMYNRENTQTHHGFGGDHSLVATVFCRCNQYDGPEAHCAWPRATLYDLNKGGFEPRPGGAKKFPHHGKDLCFWNWNVTTTGTKDFWPEGENYGYFMPPVIAGLHGKSFTIPDVETDILVMESKGQKISSIESLFEAQLTDRLGDMPEWLRTLSDAFENTVRNAGISINSPSIHSTLENGNDIIVGLSSPDGFPQSEVSKIELLVSKDGLTDGFEKVAETDKWANQISFSTNHVGTLVLKAAMVYGNGNIEESLPITVFVGNPSALNKLPIKRAAMLTHNQRADMYGQFTAVGGAEASDFPENSAYDKYKNGTLFYTVEKEFYEEQLKTYAKFGQETLKPKLEDATNMQEVNKLIDGSTSTVINNVYGYLGSMLQFDLGNEYNVGKMELVWTQSMTTSVKLEVQTSSDSMAWYSFVNDEPLWEFGVQHVGQTLSREKLPAGEISTLFLPQKQCRYIRLSAQNFPNGKLAEVRFFGSGIPQLKKLAVNGAVPYNWSPELRQYEISLPEGEMPKYLALANDDKATVEIKEPANYPGTTEIIVTDATGARSSYFVKINIAGNYLEDFEKASSGSMDGIFVGNNNVQWNIEGRFASSMGMGKCVYFYPTQRGIESMPISGGLSELSFDAENLTQSGTRNVRVSVNDQVLIDSIIETEGVYQLKKNELKVVGDIVLKIENVGSEIRKLGVDNIAWKGYAPDRNAYLKNILLDGASIVGFHKDTFKYVLKYDSENPFNEIVAQAESEAAKVQVDVMESNPPKALITVTAANGAWSEYILDFDPSLSSRQTDQNTLHIYPNPTRGNIYFSGHSCSTLNITIYNQLGQLIRTQNCKTNQFDMSVLQPGTYILEVKDGSKVMGHYKVTYGAR